MWIARPTSLRGFLLAEPFQAPFRGSDRWSAPAAPNSMSGSSTGDGGFQPFFVQRIAFRREVARGRQPQAGAVGQPHQLLRRGAADRVLADEVGALVADHRRGKDLRRAGGAGVDEERPPGSVTEPSPAPAAIVSRAPPFDFADRERALADEQPRDGEPFVDRAARRAADVDDQLRGAALLQFCNLRFYLLAVFGPIAAMRT